MEKAAFEMMFQGYKGEKQEISGWAAGLIIAAVIIVVIILS